MTTQKLYNVNCIDALSTLEPGSVDLIFTDPPYGIHGDKLDQHYNRDETFVVPGYCEVDSRDYEQFSRDWIHAAARTLKKTGSMYIVTGYTNLHHILNALHSSGLREINHLIAKYSFGVYTKNKWVSSHYHILWWGHRKPYFNGQARYRDSGDSYRDRLSVQELKREYCPAEIKNKNQLPVAFVKKFIEYTCPTGGLVVDPFAGSFSTGRACRELDINCIGYELNPEAVLEFTIE